ncbi:A/G-specific adenine glycosylase [Acidisarcina polymorpha]|uniref:Adenine DNA glycosylase n=1 Tax=Acidisarcina polymorpha TaxID=2211140 RepID=A0A2Z5FYL0_9BACT|nr:A/G-specific adenine glycosylase [Acidisarcina polymorpha]AXC11505.1 A/G-specific adenine glycosylase [Acidisarcina polymorpha]
MLVPEQIREFRARLLAWFDIHKRDLPWRRTRDPYAIWVSEIMLQQTRVAAVLDHYTRWMARFPTLEALAAAAEDEVLAAWSGLGYYRRARFLHQAVKVVAAEHHGNVPRTAAELRKLPGIGAYTSAAIASIAFGEPAAVVDGNVERVLLRQIGGGEPGSDFNAAKGARKGEVVLRSDDIQNLATELLEPARAGDYNQAMMELGATVCLPRNPMCLQCPVQGPCRTRGEHPTTARKPPISVDIGYALFKRQKGDADEFLLTQRDAGATVMPGMWELPLLESWPTDEKPLLTLRHAIMQTNYRVKVVDRSQTATRSKHLATAGVEGRWFDRNDLRGLPLTGLARKILLRLGVLLPARDSDS